MLKDTIRFSQLKELSLQLPLFVDEGMDTAVFLTNSEHGNDYIVEKENGIK